MVERVLVYIKASSPTSDEVSFLENLKVPYSCRNAQFFNKPEKDFNTVYNLANSEYVATAYGDKVVKATKEVSEEVVEEVVQEDKAVTKRNTQNKK